MWGKSKKVGTKSICIGMEYDSKPGKPKGNGKPKAALSLSFLICILEMSILQYLLSSISLLWHVDHASHYQYMMSSLSSWWQHPIPSRVAGTKCNGFDLPFFPWQSCRACLAASRLPSTWADEKCEERKQLCFKMLGKSEFHEVDRCRWHDMYYVHYETYFQMLVSNPGILSRMYPTFRANYDDRWLWTWQTLQSAIAPLNVKFMHEPHFLARNLYKSNFLQYQWIKVTN